MQSKIDRNRVTNLFLIIIWSEDGDFYGNFEILNSCFVMKLKVPQVDHSTT